MDLLHLAINKFSKILNIDLVFSRYEDAGVVILCHPGQFHFIEAYVFPA